MGKPGKQKSLSDSAFTSTLGEDETWPRAEDVAAAACFRASVSGKGACLSEPEELHGGGQHAFAFVGCRSSDDGGKQQQPGPCQPPRWQKVLWKEQPYPDNYTDSTFLQELVINADVPKRDYWQVVIGSAAVTQQLSTVIAAVAVPVHLRQHTFSAEQLLAVSALLLVVGYAVCCAITGRFVGGSLQRGVRQVVLLTGGVYLLSPLLHSLTRTISEDSIIAMTVGLLILHLYLHDYNFVNSVTDKLTGTVSLGAAVFASVLIASGMPSERDVSAHVLFCLELYLLSPFMRRYVRQASLAAHAGLTLAMVAAACGLLAPLSPNLTTVFLVATVFISLLCPRWLVRIHKFKAQINGPWDEAVPQIPTSLQQGGQCAPRAAADGKPQRCA